MKSRLIVRELPVSGVYCFWRLTVNRSFVLQEYIVWFDHLGMNDVERVGGKNASLGEMIANLSGAGVRVPGGGLPSPDHHLVQGRGAAPGR